MLSGVDGVESMRVIGLNRFNRTMRKAGEDLTELREVMLQAGKIVANAAIAEAPKRSGKLAGTIRPLAGKTYARIAIGNNRKSKSGVRYANPIHWGWLYDKNNDIPKNIKPNPFLSRASQKTEPVWTALIEAKLEKLIDQIQGA